MKLETQTHSQHHAHLACPHCGQNTVVQHGSVYTCLNCNFRRNVSNESYGDGAIGVLVLLTLFAFIVALLLGNEPLTESPVPEVQSGNIETVG